MCVCVCVLCVCFFSGRVTSWLMLYFSPFEKKVYIWRERNNSWEVASLPDQMASARIDPTTWRLYWGHSKRNRGIHSSDVKGNNEITLVPGKVILVFVSATGMILDDAIETINYTLCQGARYSSVVRAFAHGAMSRRIDPSW